MRRLWVIGKKLRGSYRKAPSTLAESAVQPLAPRPRLHPPSAFAPPPRWLPRPTLLHCRRLPVERITRRAPTDALLLLAPLLQPSPTGLNREVRDASDYAAAAAAAAHDPCRARTPHARAGADAWLHLPSSRPGCCPLRAARARAVHVSGGRQPRKWLVELYRTKRNGRRLRLQLPSCYADVDAHMRARDGRQRSGHGRVLADPAGLRHPTVLCAIHQLLLVHWLPCVRMGPARRLLYRASDGRVRILPRRHLSARSQHLHNLRDVPQRHIIWNIRRSVRQLMHELRAGIFCDEWFSIMHLLRLRHLRRASRLIQLRFVSRRHLDGWPWSDIGGFMRRLRAGLLRKRHEPGHPAGSRLHAMPRGHLDAGRSQRLHLVVHGLRRRILRGGDKWWDNQCGRMLTVRNWLILGPRRSPLHFVPCWRVHRGRCRRGDICAVMHNLRPRICGRSDRPRHSECGRMLGLRSWLILSR